MSFRDGGFRRHHQKTCKAVENSRVLYQAQFGHLSFDGSRYVAPKIWKFINEQ